MKRYIYALLLVLTASTTSAVASEVTEVSSKAFIQKWAKSFNENEPKTISAFYDQDARVDLLVSVGLWLRGHKAISESYDRDMKAVKFSDSRLKNLRVRIYDKTALVSFEHLFKYHIVEDNTDWRIHIRTTTTLRHIKDGWIIVMEHSSPIKGIERAVLIEGKDDI